MVMEIVILPLSSYPISRWLSRLPLKVPTSVGGTSGSCSTLGTPGGGWHVFLAWLSVVRYSTQLPLTCTQAPDADDRLSGLVMVQSLTIYLSCSSKLGSRVLRPSCYTMQSSLYSALLLPSLVPG